MTNHRKPILFLIAAAVSTCALIGLCASLLRGRGEPAPSGTSDVSKRQNGEPALGDLPKQDELRRGSPEIYALIPRRNIFQSSIPAKEAQPATVEVALAPAPPPSPRREMPLL